MCMGLGLPAELLTPQRSWFWAKTVFWWIVEASLTSSHTTPTHPTPWLPWQCTSRRTWSAWAGLCSLSPATPSSPSSGRTWRRAWSWWRGTTAATCATSSCTCSPPPRESNLSTTWCPWSVNVFTVFSLSRFRGLKAIWSWQKHSTHSNELISQVHVSTQPWTHVCRKLTSLRFSSKEIFYPHSK